MQDTRLPDSGPQAVPLFTPEQLEVRRKWREALRSGKYAQTNGVLKDTNGFCCLGVLCDVIEPSGWTTVDARLPVHFRHRGQGGLPHQAVRDAAGIEDVFYYSDLNDSYGKTFAEIADAVEAVERGEVGEVFSGGPF